MFSLKSSKYINIDMQISILYAIIKITRSKNTGKRKKIYLKNIIRIIIIFLSLTYILSMLLVFNEGN